MKNLSKLFNQQTQSITQDQSLPSQQPLTRPEVEPGREIKAYEIHPPSGDSR